MDNIERMAREYRAAMENSSADNSSTIDQIMILERNQLDILNSIQKVNSITMKTVNYLKSLTYRVLTKLNALNGNGSYIPAFRNTSTVCYGIKVGLLGYQIDIFVLLDKLIVPFSDIAEITALENRKTSLISYL